MAGEKCITQPRGGRIQNVQHIPQSLSKIRVPLHKYVHARIWTARLRRLKSSHAQLATVCECERAVRNNTKIREINIKELLLTVVTRRHAFGY